MARQKVVNGVYYDLTDAEEAELVARAEAADLDLSPIRQQRNSTLTQSDVTQIGDFPLGADSLADWQTYREALRDLLATAGLRNSNVVWPKSPLITRIGQAAYDTEVAKDGSGPAAGEAARTAAEGAAGYPGPGI
jgi:alkylation response protein AidB-like acyl-CoA dehydrogenase|tara:strand:- start:36 stop:440 length:405 start_codon:yes stop_codon:yes gene_type:complete